MTKGTIIQFFQGPKTGKFRTREGQVYSFGLDLIKDESLRNQLLNSWLPELAIPVSVGLFWTASGMVVTHLAPTSLTGTYASSQVPPSLPAEPGPYRDAKEFYHSGQFKLAEEKFLEAIRVNDRKISAVKDLASMLNERDRCRDAIVLLNQFLASKDIDKEERPKLVNLRENIHNRMAKGAPPSAVGAFGDCIRDILSGSARPERITAPPPAPKETEVKQEFLCIVQGTKCFPLTPWPSEPKTLSLKFPRTSDFASDQPWKVALASFSCGSDQRPKPETLVASSTRLDGAWVVPLSLGDWQASLPSTIRLAKSDKVYLRDDDIVAGPWESDGAENWVAVYGDYVYEWTWKASWPTLDFPDRTYLLDRPQEGHNNFYDFAGSEHLADWLQQKLSAAGPNVAAQYEQLTDFCKQAMSSPLDVSRWGRIQNLLGKALTAQQENFPAEEKKAPAPVEVPRVESGGGQKPSWVAPIHLATWACRCVLVPSPAHSQIYCENLGSTCSYFLLTPSVAWLSLRDAWSEFEWAWNLAHSNSDQFYVVHVEQANLSMLHHWAKPLLNCAHRLTSTLLGYSQLPWPDNLRLHWSLSPDPEAFPVAPWLRPAFAAIPFQSDLPDAWDPQSPTSCWWLDLPHSSLTSRHVDPEWGDYAQAVAQECAQLQALGQRYQWPDVMANIIRIDCSRSYWGHSDDH